MKPVSTTSLKFTIALLILVVVFLLILLAMHAMPQWHDSLRDMAFAIGPLVIFMLVWEFGLRGARSDELRELIRNTLTDRYSDIKELQRSGIRRIHPSVSNELLRDVLERAQHSIHIVVPWFVEPTILKETLARKANTSAVRIHITLLSPTSSFALKRGQMIQPAQVDYGPREVQRTLLALQEAFVRCDPERIHVFVYDSMPSAFICVVDDLALLGLHLHTGLALRNPHFEIAIRQEGQLTVLGKMVTEELDKVATISSAINLTTLRQDAKGDLVYTLL